MILADTSVWVNHFRQNDPQLQQCLLNRQVLTHPFVLGEIACGNLQSRSKLLADLHRLPSSVCAEHDEVLTFLQQHRLYGKSITWIDAHLLASARLTSCRLWTLDLRLRELASKLKISYSGVM
jgi:predicted nucleic acid-binding protein